MVEIKIGGKTRFENLLKQLFHLPLLDLSDYNQLALRARWLFYHFISNSGSWNNCYISLVRDIEPVQPPLQPPVKGAVPLFIQVKFSLRKKMLSQPHNRITHHLKKEGTRLKERQTVRISKSS